MGRPDTTAGRATVPLRAVLATGYGTAALAMPMLVVDRSQSPRSWVMLVAAELMAEPQAGVQGFRADGEGARRGRAGGSVPREPAQRPCSARHRAHRGAN